MSEQERISSRSDGHWLTFNGDHEVVGCHCGFEADMDSDCGWGDSVVDHIWNAARESNTEWGLEWDHFDGFPDITGPYADREEAERNAEESAFPARLVTRVVGPWSTPHPDPSESA